MLLTAVVSFVLWIIDKMNPYTNQETAEMHYIISRTMDWLWQSNQSEDLLVLMRSIMAELAAAVFSICCGVEIFDV